MKIFVTWATGPLSGHVVRYLTGRGQGVRVLRRDPAKADFPAELERQHTRGKVVLIP